MFDYLTRARWRYVRRDGSCDFFFHSFVRLGYSRRSIHSTGHDRTSHTVSPLPHFFLSTPDSRPPTPSHFLTQKIQCSRRIRQTIGKEPTQEIVPEPEIGGTLKTYISLSLVAMWLVHQISPVVGSGKEEKTRKEKKRKML